MKVAWELSFKIEHLWNGQTGPWKNCTFGETGVYAKMHGLADCFDVLGKPSNLGCCPCSIRWRPRFGKGLAVQINGELQKCSSSASLQDMFLNLVSNHLPRCGEKKNSIWISSTTFSKFSKREFFGVRNRESPSYRTHHLPEKALGVAPELGPPNAIFAWESSRLRGTKN